MKGEYIHTIDSKGRLIIPAKLRPELGDNFVITKGLDGCIFAYPQKEWNVLEEKIKTLPLSKSRELQRFFFSSACDCSLDTQGRILISATLRKFANITKDVTVIGVSNRAEIWDSENWNKYNNNITDIEKAMEDIGF